MTRIFPRLSPLINRARCERAQNRKARLSSGGKKSSMNCGYTADPLHHRRDAPPNLSLCTCSARWMLPSLLAVTGLILRAVTHSCRLRHLCRHCLAFISTGQCFKSLLAQRSCAPFARMYIRTHTYVLMNKVVPATYPLEWLLKKGTVKPRQIVILDPFYLSALAKSVMRLRNTTFINN